MVFYLSTILWAVWALLTGSSLLCGVARGHSGVVWSAYPRTPVGTTKSKIALHTCPGPLLGLRKGCAWLCLSSTRSLIYDMVVQGSETEIGNCQASQELGPELAQTSAAFY